jgi:Glycosyl transferase family 64 domain
LFFCLAHKNPMREEFEAWSRRLALEVRRCPREVSAEVVRHPLSSVATAACFSSLLSMMCVGTVLASQVGIFRDWDAWVARSEATATASTLSASESVGGTRASVVLMSFSRPAACVQLVEWYLAQSALHDAVREVVVWDARPEGSGGVFGALAARVEAQRAGGAGLPRVTVLSLTPDVGLHSRFAAALIAREPVVLMQDDDLRLSVRGIRRLLRSAAEAPEVLHGVYPRFPNKARLYETYEYRSLHSAPVVLTKVLVGRREHFAQFFVVEPFLAPLARLAKPAWNGEDIVLNMAVAWRNGGRLNAAHPELQDEVQTIGPGGGISGWADHLRFRRELTLCTFRTLGFDLPGATAAEATAPLPLRTDQKGKLPLLAPLPDDAAYLGMHTGPLNNSWIRYPCR